MQQFLNKANANTFVCDRTVEKILFSEFDPIKGISKGIRKITKEKAKKLIDKANTVMWTGKSPMIVLELYSESVEEIKKGSNKGVINQLLMYIKRQ